MQIIIFCSKFRNLYFITQHLLSLRTRLGVVVKEAQTCFVMIMPFKDLQNPEFPIQKNKANKIMHIALPIGKTF
ncbi:hypothetical protein [Lacihabitans sp. CCS-44]|uniref:hypothetical protein n=1 Tax=Lacihabitans sp. CCS-44 TaxID=2487331 RepID=UPI0020CF64AE|nr:hypothetical protein [Lacihabitans sp. CCS-44]